MTTPTTSTATSTAASTATGQGSHRRGLDLLAELQLAHQYLGRYLQAAELDVATCGCPVTGEAEDPAIAANFVGFSDRARFGLWVMNLGAKIQVDAMEAHTTPWRPTNEQG